MDRSQLYISTVSAGCDRAAARHGLGLEIAEYCTASNLDAPIPQVLAAAESHRQAASRFVFHAPFNELCPAAIDPLVRAVTRRRFLQAAALAKRYGAEKMVVHSGFIPLVYYPEWYAPQAADFWRGMLEETDGLIFCVENVLEESPDVLLQTAELVGDPRLRVCLDVGHALCQSGELAPWLDALAPYCSHVHLHNNSGAHDEHRALFDGALDMAALIRQLERLAPQATYTLEVFSARPSVEWLLKEGLLL